MTELRRKLQFLNVRGATILLLRPIPIMLMYLILHVIMVLLLLMFIAQAMVRVVLVVVLVLGYIVLVVEGLFTILGFLDMLWGSCVIEWTSITRLRVW